MGILNKELFNEEELKNSRIRYESLIYYFNKINEEQEGMVDQLTYLDYHKLSNGTLSIEEWLEFLSDYRVSMILDKVMLINMRSNVNKILSADNKSVAASQKLSSALSFLSKYFDEAMGRESVIYIYTSVPLTKEEEYARNAKTLVVRPKKNPHNPMKGSNDNGI